MRKNPERRTVAQVLFAVKTSAWHKFLLHKYAEHFGVSLGTAFSDAVNCLADASISRELAQKWANEHRAGKQETG